MSKALYEKMLIAPLNERVEVDALLGAVSTCDLERSHSDLYFNRIELNKLFADPSYPYASETEFLQAFESRFAGSHVVRKVFSNRLIVRLSPESADDIRNQIAGVVAVASARSPERNR